MERDLPKGDSLGSLPGAKVGGSRPQRLERIVDYFDRMVFRDVPAQPPEAVQTLHPGLPRPPSIGPAADHAAARLKIESGTDTDVALIAAEWTVSEVR